MELNRTCRPYHLGWILEAWSGHEEFPATVALHRGTAVSVPRVPLFGVEVDADTRTTAVEHAREIVRCRVQSQHVVLNAAKVVAMNESPELRDVVRSCAW